MNRMALGAPPRPGSPTGVSTLLGLVAEACGTGDAAAVHVPIKSQVWPQVFALAQRHRVEGLVWQSISAADRTLPAQTAEAFRSEARQIASAGLAHAAESARLQQALSAVAPCLVLKGSAVEMLAYGRLGLKSAWDIDLLVAPDRVGAAMAVLADEGYEIVEPAGLSARQFATWVAIAKECELRHPRTDLRVELHWRLVDGPSMLPGLSVCSPTQEVALGGGLSVTAFARDELFAYLCVHGAMHGWSRLKWLADLAAWLSREPPETLEPLWRRSVALGAGRCSAQALLLCRDLLGLAIPPALETELRRSGVVRWLVRQAASNLEDPREIEARPFAATRILLAQMLLGGTWRHAFAEFGYRWISLHDRVHLPLPPALTFLYPLLRIPLWLVRRLRPARAS